MRTGERLRQLRKARRISQEELAGQLSMTRANVSKLETGEGRIDADLVPRLAAILGVSPCDFFEEPAAEERPDRPFHVVGGLTATARAELAEVVRSAVREELDRRGVAEPVTEADPDQERVTRHMASWARRWGELSEEEQEEAWAMVEERRKAREQAEEGKTRDR